MMLHRLAFAACLAIAVITCFNPHPAANLMCGPADECPPGQTCGLDGLCHTTGTTVPDASPSDGTPIDAAVDAPPDVPMVQCQGDMDCLTPPDVCSKPGTCNLVSHTCDFGAVDCSSKNDDCNVGVCDLGTGSCVASARNEGNTCGAGTACGPFGPCGDFSSVCDGSGTQTRPCTDHTCRSGACMASARNEMATCTRSTNGVTCSSPTESNCNACSGFSDVCDNTGTHNCTCTSFACQNEVCMPTNVSCTTACTRNTNGTMCSPNTMTCNACQFPSTCANSGPDASCTCSSFSCQSGTCEQHDASCSQPCTRNRDGFPCGCQQCGMVGTPIFCSGGACTELGICGDC
jgi:hypothetical protein